MATIVTEESQLADKNNNPLIGQAQTHVADAEEAHDVNATFADTEVEAALDALGGKINDIFLILKAHGLMKAS
jgi:hypothetical protein